MTASYSNAIFISSSFMLAQGKNMTTANRFCIDIQKSILSIDASKDTKKVFRFAIEHNLSGQYNIRQKYVMFDLLKNYKIFTTSGKLYHTIMQESKQFDSIDELIKFISKTSMLNIKLDKPITKPKEPQQKEPQQKEPQIIASTTKVDNETTKVTVAATPISTVFTTNMPVNELVKSTPKPLKKFKFFATNIGDSFDMYKTLCRQHSGTFDKRSKQWTCYATENFMEEHFITVQSAKDPSVTIVMAPKNPLDIVQILTAPQNDAHKYQNYSTPSQPNNLIPPSLLNYIEYLRKKGISYNKITADINTKSLNPNTGKPWSTRTVCRYMAKLRPELSAIKTVYQTAIDKNQLAISLY